MNKYKNKKDYKPCTKDDIEELGSFKHKCEDLIIISVTNANIPYPNSMVFSKKLEQIGKIDEVLGSFDDVYVSIAPTDNKTEKIKEGTVFYCDKRKLMPKSRFISRTDTEKIKEEKDKRKTNDSYKNRNSSFNSKEGGYRNKTNDSYKNRNSSFNSKDGRDNSINRNSNFQDKNNRNQFNKNSNRNYSSNTSNNTFSRNNDKSKYNLQKRDKPMNHNKDLDKRKKSE